jgi:PAS domain S-box-containing protein
MYCIARDAAEGRETENKLQKSDQKIVNVLESITDGFYILDKNWTVTYWNKEAEKILLVNGADIIGRNIWETYTDIAELRIYSEYKNVMTSRISASFEEFMPHLELWVEMNVYPFEEGISVYFKKINERKVAEENIRVAKERYDWGAKATNDAIWDWDVKTNGLIWGDGFKTMFGYDVLNMTVTLDSWAEHIHPDDLKRVSEKIRACVYGSEDLQWEDEYQYIKADGSYAYVYDRGFVIRDENGIAIRMIGAMQDITERKHNEQVLNGLHVEVQKRAEELALSNTELEQFAYVDSHDLQEPLRMVTGFLNQLDKHYSDKLDDKAKKYIHFAVDGAVRMRQIILDLLEYSRVGRHGYDMQLIDLNELIAETVHLNKPLIEESNSIINWGDLPTIKGAKNPLQQVFQNIINNALKYKNTVNTPAITINAIKKDKHWLISIEDNGIGIDPEFFAKIFVLFKRLHNKEEYSGNGIGLAICKKIIENHGGKIWVESVLGKGSVFYFTIMR